MLTKNASFYILDKLKMLKNSRYGILYTGRMKLMLTKEKMDRINELARKKKAEGLTPEETKEQEILRKEYIVAFRAQIRGQLDNIRYVEDMTEEELAEYNRKKNQ